MSYFWLVYYWAFRIGFFGRVDNLIVLKTVIVIEIAPRSKSWKVPCRFLDGFKLVILIFLIFFVARKLNIGIEIKISILRWRWANKLFEFFYKIQSISCSVGCRSGKTFFHVLETKWNILKFISYNTRIQLIRNHIILTHLCKSNLCFLII